MKKALGAASALILFLCAFPLAFLMVTDKILETANPGRPYALNLSTGCFDEKFPRLIRRVKDLECLTPEERQALLSPAASSEVPSGDSASAARALESARSKVRKAQELYEQRVAAHHASRAASLESMKNPVGTLVQRLGGLFE